MCLATGINEYTAERGQWIAGQVAGGPSVAALARDFPEHVPAPLVVARWRRQYPQFDLLMAEAEAVRADYLAEQCLEVADDESRTAAHATNGIKVRQSLAAALHPSKYGQGAAGKRGADDKGEPASLQDMTDAELMAVARGAVEEVQARIAGQRAPADPPGPPAGRARTGFERKGSELQTPASLPGEYSVIPNDFPDMDAPVILERSRVSFLGG